VSTAADEGSLMQTLEPTDRNCLVPSGIEGRTKRIRLQKKLKSNTYAEHTELRDVNAVAA